MKSKNKMVSFRLSADEYSRLREAAAGLGVTNLSELARSAMHQVLIERGNGPHVAIDVQLIGLRAKLESLHDELDRLSKLVSEPVPAGSHAMNSSREM